MKTYIVSDKNIRKSVLTENFFQKIPNSNFKIIKPDDYILNPNIIDGDNVFIINLCSSYDYLTAGYYVSLIAEARGHKVIPNIIHIQDLKSKKILHKIVKWIIETIKDLNSISNEYYDYLDISLNEYIIYNVYSKYKFILREIKNQNKDFKKNSELAILYNPNGKNLPSMPETINKFKDFGKNVMGFNVDIIYPNDIKKIPKYDALFIRDYTHLNNYTYIFSRISEILGLVVIDDPNSILKCMNKVFFTELSFKNDISIPKTYIINRINYLDIVDKLEYPCVIKKPDSSFSRGVFKVNNKDEFIKKVKSLFKNDFLLLVQEFIYTQFDWRIGILDKKPLFACKYFMAKDHWQIYNWSIKSKNKIEYKEGGTETLSIKDVPEEVVNMAIKSASLIGDGLYGVDIKYKDGKVYVMEVNENPNIDVGYEDKVVGDFLYESIFNYFSNRIK